MGRKILLVRTKTIGNRTNYHFFCFRRRYLVCNLDNSSLILKIIFPSQIQKENEHCNTIYSKLPLLFGSKSRYQPGA